MELSSWTSLVSSLRVQKSMEMLQEMAPEATTSIRQCLSEAWLKHGKTLSWSVI